VLVIFDVLPSTGSGSEYRTLSLSKRGLASKGVGLVYVEALAKACAVSFSRLVRMGNPLGGFNGSVQHTNPTK